MTEDSLKRARILVVDDEPQNVRYLKDVLEWAGYENVEGTSDPVQALPLFQRFEPDLVILDLLMPVKDGFEVLGEIQAHVGEGVYLPVLVLTSDVSRETRRRAMSEGARDFLTKPMSPTEVRIRVQNLLEARFLYLRCARLERTLGRAGTAAPASADAGELLERWARSVELATDGSGQHAKRVSWTAGKIAGALGLPEHEVQRIQEAALLHDLGKIVVFHGPAQGPAEAADGFREHPEKGAELLAGSRSPVLRLAAHIARAHHENWDGSGFPDGLSGEEIPLPARIVAVADHFDHVQYDESDDHSAGEALAAVEREAGRRFDPRVVEALAAVLAAQRA